MGNFIEYFVEGMIIREKKEKLISLGVEFTGEDNLIAKCPLWMALETEVGSEILKKGCNKIMIEKFSLNREKNGDAISFPYDVDNIESLIGNVEFFRKKGNIFFFYEKEELCVKPFCNEYQIKLIPIYKKRESKKDNFVINSFNLEINYKDNYKRVIEKDSSIYKEIEDLEIIFWNYY